MGTAKTSLKEAQISILALYIVIRVYTSRWLWDINQSPSAELLPFQRETSIIYFTVNAHYLLSLRKPLPFIMSCSTTEML